MLLLVNLEKIKFFFLKLFIFFFKNKSGKKSLIELILSS